MRTGKLVLSAVLALIFCSAELFAQRATSDLTGDVVDQSGAVVQGADVALTDTSTNTTLTTKTNQAGHYSFSAVQPGQYRMTVKKAGFRQSLTTVTVSIGQNSSQNFTMEVGGATETVEVQATGAELQTVDASVGNVLRTQSLESLPSLTRDVTALLLLQPMAAPSFNSSPDVGGVGEGDGTSGAVAGALSDQNTFNLDGGDATSNTEGDAGYANKFQGTPKATVPTPVESIEEFRVVTNNSNTFARSSGANVAISTRRGSNAWHGAGYEYNQNTLYNANSWQLNHINKPRTVWQDNRFGGRVGGPILKDKAFFFLMYEGRRFQKGEQFSRLVPSDLLKQGIIRFFDGSGNIVQYNFTPGAPTARCAAGACDPRGFGMSPVIGQLWNQFEPSGNDPTQGDGLNTIGFVSSVPLITHEHDGIARFDYNLSQNWSLMVSGRYAVAQQLGSAQVDIGGLTGGTKGVPHSTENDPLQPRYYVIGLTGRIGTNITNDTHFNFLRHYWQWARTAPFPQLPVLGAALQVYAESNVNGLVPMNVDTQNARSRVWDGKDFNLNDDVSWLRGSHLVQFGGSFRHQHFFHVRDDKVVGGLAEPLYFVDWGQSYNNFDVNCPGCFRPVICPSDTSGTNCLRPSDETNWDKIYAATMGMVSHSAQLLTRAADLTPNPPGTPNKQNTLVDDYDLHFVDTWHMTPSFTLTYGLDWGVQTPPYESNGLQTIMTYFSSGQQVTYDGYMRQLQASALAGVSYGPELGFMPIRKTSRKYPSDIDWHNFAPRFSVAWNPRGQSGLFNHLFGDSKSVIRAGYGRYFDRLNGVGLVMTPALGIGFGNGVQCRRVKLDGSCGGSKTDPSNAFRIGVDGNTVQIPSLSAITPPVVPGVTPDANTPFQTFDFRIDPHRKVGVEDTWTLSIQRQLSNSTLFEVGYVGRRGIHLYGANDISQVPYMFTLGGQQFQTAYDAVQKQLIAQNYSPTAVVTPQPFFEKAVGPGGTQSFALANETLFSIGDATDLFDALGVNTMPFDQQFLGTQMSTAQGRSRYNAGYISVREQMKQGLMFQANYTYSHSLDDAGLGQQNVFISPSDGFNRSRDYESSYFDRRHTFTGFFVYDLPFGPSHRFGAGGLLSRLLGGWELSSSFTIASGLPEKVFNGNSCLELGDGFLTNCSSWIPVSSSAFANARVHHVSGSLNAFANPTALEGICGQGPSCSYRMPFFGDQRMGGTPVVGFPRWNMDASLSKKTNITERVSLGLVLQAVNVFNHMEFTDPASAGFLDISNTTTFGALNTQYTQPRFLSIGARIDF